MKVGVDCNKVGSHTNKGLICFNKACYRSMREYAFIFEIIVFFVLLYVFLPSVFFFLLSNSPVIVCTAVLLGTLLSFGQTNIPEIIEKGEETTKDISSFKVAGNNVSVENDGNSEMETPLLTKDGYPIEATEEDDIRERSVDDDGGEIVCRKDSQCSDSEEEEDEEDEEKEKRITPVFHVQRQEDVKIMPSDEAEVEVVFTPRDISRKEEIQLGRGHLGRGIHGNRTEVLRVGESQEDSVSKSKLICRSNSRRTVRFVMNDVEKAKEEKKTEEEHAEESRRKDEESAGQEKNPDAHTESPWTRIDRLSRINHDDQSSHSSSEHSESSSPDASMTDIMPMLDELDPLLDAETPQPASVEASERNSEESENHDSGEDDDDDDDYDGDDNDDDEDTVGSGKKGAKIREGEHEGHKDMKRVPWTDDDIKNVMDLGSSELERNQRLENLMAKRRARKNQKIEIKDLIDLQSDDKISLLDDDSSFNALLDSVSLHTSPFLFRSATLPIKRNPFDLPCDGEEETAQPSIPSSARVPSTLSTRRNPFDFPYDHVDVDKQLVGETSGHGEFMTIHQKGLYTGETHLLGRHFEGIDQEKRDANMSSVYNMAAVNAVAGFLGFSQVNSSVIANHVQPQKQERNNSGSDSVVPSFDGHVAKTLDHHIHQASTYTTHRLEQGINGASNKSSLMPTGLVSSIEARKDHEILQGACNKSGTVCARSCVSVESSESELSSTETESQSSEEAAHMEIREEQNSCKAEIVHATESIASIVTEEHIQATLGSPEHDVVPLDESPSKQYAGSGAEEKFDDSSSSTSSEAEETKSDASINQGNGKCCSGSSTGSEVGRSESMELRILRKDADDNQVGEPVFDSSPSAIEKMHSALSSISEADLFMEKRDSQNPSTVSDAPMETSESGSPGDECREENANDESKAVDTGSIMSDAASLPVRDDQTLLDGSNLSHKGEEIPELKEVLDMHVGSPIIGQNVRTIQVEPASVVLENTARDPLHVADSSQPVSPSSRDNHLIVEGETQHVDEVNTIQHQESAESFHKASLSKDNEVLIHVDSHSNDAAERLDGAIGQPEESAIHLSSVGYHTVKVGEPHESGNLHVDYVEPVDTVSVGHTSVGAAATVSSGAELLEPEGLNGSSLPSGLEGGISEIARGGLTDQLSKRIHVSSSVNTEREIVDECYFQTPRLSETILPVIEDHEGHFQTPRVSETILPVIEDHEGYFQTPRVSETILPDIEDLSGDDELNKLNDTGISKE